MRIVKYLAILAMAFCAIASASNAQQTANLAFLGGGSSALFLELGQSAVAFTGTPATGCYWTHNADTTNVLARDARTATPTDENGKVWVVWTTGTGGTCAAPASDLQVYMYMNLDSVLGDRCYFENDGSGTPGCVQIFTVANGTAGLSPSLLGTGYTDTAISTNVINAINGKHWFVAGTDIRPEDAKFASLRMFTACGQSVPRAPFQGGLSTTTGLGYQTSTTGVGTTLQSFYSTATFHVLDFNITGNDPIKTTQPVPSYTVSTVGAQPIVVSVAPNPSGGTAISAATDISLLTLANFYEGVLGRSTDLIGPTTTEAVTTLVREPLSGTYNTFEFNVPGTVQFKGGSQDDFNCSGNVANSNPMHIQGTNGNIASFRNRVIGTGEMTAQLQAASSSTLGYFFWSSANAAKFTATNGKYLTVNGQDPLLNAYSDGIFPGVDAGHPLSNITFKGLNQGDYPIWSALRLVSTSPTPAGVTNLISGAQTLNSTQFDFVPLSKLAVWHSHFALPAINIGNQANGPTINPATPNDLCNPTGSGGAFAEAGGDVGGSNVLKANNSNFCHDFGNPQGLINRNN